MVSSRDPENEEPGPEQLYDVGLAGTVARMLKVPDGTLRVLVQGAQRVKIEERVSDEPYLVARVSELPEVVTEGTELEALERNVKTMFTQIIEQAPYLPEELQMAVANVDDPSALSYLIAARCGPGRGAPSAARGGRRREAPAPALGGPGARARGRRDRHPGSTRRSSPRWTRPSASTTCASS